MCTLAGVGLRICGEKRSMKDKKSERGVNVDRISCNVTVSALTLALYRGVSSDDTACFAQTTWLFARATAVQGATFTCAVFKQTKTSEAAQQIMLLPLCTVKVPWGTPHACTKAPAYMFAKCSDVGVGTFAVKNEVDISENVTVPACSSRGSYRWRSSYRGLLAPACPML